MMDEKQLLDDFFKSENSKTILKCIQCGTCSGSCPLSDQMDHAPRQVFALIRDGDIKTALQSNTPWFCVSCYQCMVRCPKEIPVTDLMYKLKQMAFENDLAPESNKVPDLYRAFTTQVKQTGIASESLIMARYSLKHPLDALGNIPLGLRLLQRMRFEFFLPKLKKHDKIAQLMVHGDKEAK